MLFLIYAAIISYGESSIPVVSNLFRPGATFSLLKVIRGHNVIFKRNFSRYNYKRPKTNRLNRMQFLWLNIRSQFFNVMLKISFRQNHTVCPLKFKLVRREQFFL